LVVGFGASLSGRILNQWNPGGRHQLFCAGLGSTQLIKINRDKASSLRMFEDATFISIQELPPHSAQADKGEKYRRSESFEYLEEIPHERMSGDR